MKVEVRGVKTVYVGGYYRRDKSDEESAEQLANSLEKFSNRTESHIWLAGDLNYPGFDWETGTLLPNCSYVNLHRRFLDILDDNNLTQVVTDATRDNATLDLICVSNSSLVEKVQVIPGISDHDAVLMDSNISLGRNQQQPREIPIWSKADWPSVRSHMETSWASLSQDYITGSSADTLWNWFKDTLEAGLKEHVPTRLSTKRDHKPWMSTTLKKMIKRSKKLFRRKQDYPSRKNIEAYRSAQASIQKTTRKEYWKYMDGILYPEIGTGADRNKQLWTVVKHAKKDSIGVAPLLDVRTGNKTTNPTEKAEVLNNQFQKAFSLYNPMKLANICKQFLWQTNSNTVPEEHQIKYPIMPKFEFGENGIKKLLGTLKPNKAAGPDRLRPLALKQTRDQIAPILQVIFTKSYETGQVPKDWKTANVAPVFKKGDKFLPINYRPVSLTCICSKTMEHIIASQMGKHLEKHNIIDKNQHGFRKGLSCETQLLDYVEDLHRSLAKGDQIDSIVMDFSKAFDKVPHKPLVFKLREYGLENNTVAWIEDWLTDRSQQVVVEGMTSHTISVTSGVPQGSVLGPILFLLFINDISKDTSSTIRLFADDTIMYRPIRCEADALALQRDLDRLEKWSRDWQMEFHPDKCKVIHVTRKVKKLSYKYSIYNTELESVTSVKYLGIEISQDLRWNKHIESSRAKASQTLGFLQRNLRISNTSVKTTAYQAYVRPRLEYASNVWDPFYDKQKKSLESVQRRAARWVLGRWNQRSSVTDMIAHLEWVTLERRRAEARLSMMYKMRNNLLKLDTSHILYPMTGIAQSANPHKLTPPQHKNILLHRFSFFPWTVVQWNALPPTVAQAPSLNSFKSQLSHVPNFARPKRQY